MNLVFLNAKIKNLPNIILTKMSQKLTHVERFFFNLMSLALQFDSESVWFKEANYGQLISQLTAFSIIEYTSLI